MYKILVNDGLSKDGIKELEKLGFKVCNIHYEKDELKDRIKDFHCIVIRSLTNLNYEILKSGREGNLKLVIRAGVGTDNIDVNGGKSLGIEIRNTPLASSKSVAELILGHIFSLARFLGDSNVSMRKGEWNKKKYKGIEIEGKTLGIIGMGRIGKALGEKASALGMKVVYYTIEGEYKELNYEFLTFEEVLKNSDFLSLNIPCDKNTSPLIGEREINMMKDGSYIINCSRGRVIDEDALLKGLDSGKINGAGLDVFMEEPTLNKKLINHERVSVTPHIGASTIEAQEKIGNEIVKIIKEFFNV